MRKGLVLFLAVSVVSLLAVASASAEVVRGKVTEIDLNASRLAVQTTDGQSLALSFDKEDFIVWRGDDEVEAKEIQTGSEAEVGYYADESGAKIASWVDLTPVETMEEPAASAEELGEEIMETEEQPAITQPEAQGEPGMQPEAKEHPGKEHPGN